MTPFRSRPVALDASATAGPRRLLAALLGATLIVGIPAMTGASAARADETITVPATDPVAPAVDPAAIPVADPAAVPVAEPVAVAAPAVALALGARNLRLGDVGEDVLALQALLRVGQTGTFDVPTRKAVKKAQRASGLKASGVLTAKTLKAIQKAEKQRRATKKASRGALPRAGSPTASKRYARAYIARTYGWGAGQMSCLNSIWTRESGWRYWVSNPNGIYRGIPQTSSRVWGASGYSTSQYMRNPAIQIKVGAKYIKKRYGSPCNAWSFWRAHHWY